MAGPTVRVPLKAIDTNETWRLSGNGATRADALAEAKSRLKVTAGIYNGNVTISDAPTAGELSALVGPGHSTGGYSDVSFVLERVSGAVRYVRSFRLNNVSTTYAVSGSGAVDIANADIADIATQYTDGTGTKGYTIKSAKWVA